MEDEINRVHRAVTALRAAREELDDAQAEAQRKRSDVNRAEVELRNAKDALSKAAPELAWTEPEGQPDA